MPRRARSCPGGFVYHVLNRAAASLRLFSTDKDYLAFERILVEAHERHPLAIYEWCLLPNHWHVIVRPERDGDVTDFFRWLTHTHAMRWHAAKRAVGSGALYQGRFKCFPIEQDDEHMRTVLRYVSRNALTAGLTKRSAIDWRWSGSHAREHGIEPVAAILLPLPVELPRDWQRYVDRAQTPAEIEAVELAIRRGRPFGTPAWVAKTARKLDLDWTLIPRGRPRVEAEKK